MSKEVPKPGHRYVLDLQKLFITFENKRKQDKLSRERVAVRYGLSKSALSFNRSNKDSLDAKLLIPVLLYLDKPITEFIKMVEVNDNGGKNRRDSENSE